MPYAAVRNIADEVKEDTNSFYVRTSKENVVRILSSPRSRSVSYTERTSVRVSYVGMTPLVLVQHNSSLPGSTESWTRSHTPDHLFTDFLFSVFCFFFLGPNSVVPIAPCSQPNETNTLPRHRYNICQQQQYKYIKSV